MYQRHENFNYPITKCVKPVPLRRLRQLVQYSLKYLNSFLMINMVRKADIQGKNTEGPGIVLLSMYYYIVFQNGRGTGAEVVIFVL